MRRPPPIPLFRGTRLRLLHDAATRTLEIRDTESSKTLLALPSVRLYAARRDVDALVLHGAFDEGDAPTDEYRRTITGDYGTTDLDGLARALHTSFELPGELPLVDPSELAADPRRFHGKHVRVRGEWRTGFELNSFSPAGACLNAPNTRAYAGDWRLEVTGVWHTREPGKRHGFGHLGVMPHKIDVLELHLLDRLGDPHRPSIPADKRRIVAQGRTIDFETHLDGRWRVLVDDRPIAMTLQKRERGVTGSGRVYDDLSPRTPVRWADLGGYLAAAAPLELWPVRGRTQLTCSTSSRASIHNTVIYGDATLQLDFTADFTAVEILESTYRDSST